MKKNQRLNQKEREILRALKNSRTGMTPYEVSKKTGITWVTVKKYLKNLKRKGVVV